MDPGDTPHENLNFLFFCAAAVAAVNKHQALLRATAANVGQDHRLGANEAPPAIISIFLGHRSPGRVRRDRRRRNAVLSGGRVPQPRDARPADPPAPRRRSQPDLAVRLHRQQVRVPDARLEPVDRPDQHRPQHDRRRGDRRARRRARGQAGRRAWRSTRPSSRSSRTATAPTVRSSSAATTTPPSGTPRPRSAAWPTSRRRPTPCRRWSPTRRSRCSRTTASSRPASSTRATRCSSSSTTRS